VIVVNEEDCSRLRRHGGGSRERRSGGKLEIRPLLIISARNEANKSMAKRLKDIL
jgi:hypothetical protein